jgi:hypothetical protein
VLFIDLYNITPTTIAIINDKNNIEHAHANIVVLKRPITNNIIELIIYIAIGAHLIILLYSPDASLQSKNIQMIIVIINIVIVNAKGFTTVDEAIVDVVADEESKCLGIIIL